MDEANFESEWQVIGGLKNIDQVAQEVKTLLSRAYAAANAEPPDTSKLILQLDELLTFLGSPQGRTDANCWATDLFLKLAEGWNWEGLPEELTDVMGDMAGALHDTVSHPHIAANFGGL